MRHAFSRKTAHTNLGDKSAVIIYADPLLTPSSTFVRSQAEAIRDFVPCYAGARAYLNSGLELPKGRTVVINDKGTQLGKLKEIPFKVFGFAPIFIRELRKFRPVLIHAHTGPHALAALPLACWMQIPLIATFHGSDVMVDPLRAKNLHRAHRIYVRQRKLLQRNASLFIAVSKFVLTRLIEQGFPAGRTVLHYIGVDTEFFMPDPRFCREDIVLFVGTLHEVKGCEYLIRAMTKVQAEMPEVELVVIGDGPLRSDLERKASRMLRRYRFLGTQPSQIVREWMNRARVFSVPSVPAHSGATEAFGLVFIESQSMGLPVVSFRTGGISEAVAHEETGLLAPEKDWEGLANYILLLLRDENVWKRMSEAGRNRVQQLFKLSAQTRQLERLYWDVLEDKERMPSKISPLRCMLESRFG